MNYEIRTPRGKVIGIADTIEGARKMAGDDNVICYKRAAIEAYAAERGLSVHANAGREPDMFTLQRSDDDGARFYTVGQYTTRTAAKQKRREIRRDNPAAFFRILPGYSVN